MNTNNQPQPSPSTTMARRMTLTYGEMFAGYGGLGMGVQSVLGGSMAWCAEFDAAPSKILTHHWPDIPNLGDVTKIDWANVPKVDVITGGSPCQDLSHAGKRAGMKAGTRSGLWASMCDAINIIRPSLVVWENVRGALSAEADSDMEQCPGCMGDPDDGPVLRALGRVLGDMADLGYDASWHGLRAADVGAPHGRFRIFVFACPADATGDGWHERRPEPARVVGGPDAALSGDTPPADAGVQRHGRGQDRAGLGRVDSDDAGETRQRERSREVAGDRSPEAAADADGVRPRVQVRGVCREETQERVSGHLLGADIWGQYAPAINRWEHTLGRAAPAPTETGPKSGQRLSPLFVEWMMGLPEGHVTDPAIGISRNDQLKALGNGVIPAQAAAATRTWLTTYGRDL